MAEQCPDPQAQAKPSDDGRFYGKYRGVVIDNIDLEMRGRVLAEIPQLPMELLNWALPSVPYAGPEVGFYAIPPIGSNVWVEFEGGNPNYPIWSGCFWLEGEFPFAEALDPLDPALVKVLRTDFITLILNDTPVEGGMLLEVMDPAVAVPVTVTINSTGMEINTGVSTIVINPEEGITLDVAESVVAISEAVTEIECPEINVTATNTSVESAVEVVGNVEITGAVEIEGNTEITGATEIVGDLEVTGATELLGDLSVLGAAEFLGDLSVLGAAEFLGDLTVLGAGEFLGDLAVLGAEEVVGDLAVAGAIEGVLFGAVVPPI